MLIQPVSLATVNSGKGINTPKYTNMPEYKIVQNNDVFQPSFKSYNNLLETLSRINYRKDRAVDEAFVILFHELLTEPKIVQKAEVSGIINIYKNMGFRGLMHELWKAVPDESIVKIIEKLENESQVLISKDNIPLLEIINMGRHGFWNTLFNRKSAPRDTRLTFLSNDDRYLFEFGLDKHGAVQICQKRPGETVYTTFHKSTGNRKIVASHPHKYGNPETYYYKPDGTDDDFKNHIQGGPVINIW